MNRISKLSFLSMLLVGACIPVFAQEEIYCTLEYNPVCGADGVTYSNTCVAEQTNGIQVLSVGPCEDSSFRITNDQKPPIACQTRYDGCNSCQVGIDSGELIGCTKKACLEQGEATCEQYYYAILEEKHLVSIQKYFAAFISKIDAQKQESVKDQLAIKIDGIVAEMEDFQRKARMTQEARRSHNLKLDVLRYLLTLIK